LSKIEGLSVSSAFFSFSDFAFVTKSMLEVKAYTASKNLQQSQKNSCKTQSDRLKIKPNFRGFFAIVSIFFFFLIGVIYLFFLNTIWWRKPTDNETSHQNETRIIAWAGSWIFISASIIIFTDISLMLKMIYSIITAIVIFLSGFAVYYLTKPKKPKPNFIQHKLIEPENKSPFIQKTSSFKGHKLINTDLFFWFITGILGYASIFFVYVGVKRWQTITYMVTSGTPPKQIPIYLLDYNDGYSIISVVIGIGFLIALIWYLRKNLYQKEGSCENSVDKS
jgi:hypothetical protein